MDKGSTPESAANKHPSFWMPMALMFTAGVGISFAWYVAINGWSFQCQVERAGPLGDSFGPLTSLFTSLALGASVIATYYQVREFRSQLAEMQKNADEMEYQTDILHHQRLNAEIRDALNQLPFFTVIMVTAQGQGTLLCDLFLTNHGSAVYNFKMSCEGFVPNNDRDTAASRKPIFAQSQQLEVFYISPKSVSDYLAAGNGLVTVTYKLSNGIQLTESIKIKTMDHLFESDREKQANQVRSHVEFLHPSPVMRTNAVYLGQ